MKYIVLAFTCVMSVVHVFAQPAITTGTDKYLSHLLDNTLRFDSSSINTSNESFNDTVDTEVVWKSWETVENFAYGKDRGSLPMIADLESLHPYFRDKINTLITLCKAQGIELKVVETFRTHAKQAEYFGMGKKYTRSKGGKSKHQYGLAVDVVPVMDSIAIWDNAALWRKIGITGEKLGLRWGGRWRAPYDPAHFEWSGGITTTQLADGLQPTIPRSHAALYPCIEEEVKLLQKYWEAWEVEQSVTARSTTAKPSEGTAGQNP
jgi:hypothetical protein